MNTVVVVAAEFMEDKNIGTVKLSKRRRVKQALRINIVLLIYSPLILSDLINQFLDLQTVLPANLNCKQPSLGHISTQRKQKMHWDVAISPLFPS
jgi:hypothetical protein